MSNSCVSIITPWPPQLSGIAEYSWDLAHSLSSYFSEIRIVNSSPLSSLALPQSSNIFLSDHPYDNGICLHMIGNNLKYHSLNFRYIDLPNSIFHFHDASINHVFLEILKKNVPAYYKCLKKVYGLPSLADVFSNRVLSDSCNGSQFWDNSLFRHKYTFLEVILPFCNKFICHSKYAHSIISSAFKSIPCIPASSLIIDQTYDVSNYQPIYSNSDMTFGIFGHLSESKKVPHLLDSFAHIHKNFSLPFHIILATPDISLVENKSSFRYLISKSLLSIFLKPSLIDLNNHLASVDYVFSLRYPTVGETSAIASKAIQLNKPLIVFSEGWFTEIKYPNAIFFDHLSPLTDQILRILNFPFLNYSPFI